VVWRGCDVFADIPKAVLRELELCAWIFNFRDIGILPFPRTFLGDRILVMSQNLSSITAETTMQELVSFFPGAQRALFRGYHIGGCSSCGFQPSETLAQVCERNGGLAVGEVIGFLSQAQEADSRLEVSPVGAQEAVRNGSAVLVDIRSGEEFNAVSIPGSILFTEQLMHEIPGWDRAKEIIFVCHHGIRSMDAA
jgi:Rhodanese-like domain